MRAGFLLLMSWLSSADPPGAETPAPTWRLRDVAAESGLELRNLSGSHESKLLIVEQLGAGGALLDYDLDGDLDLFFANGADLAILRGERPPVRNALYRNDGTGEDGIWHFVDVTRNAGVGDTGWGLGAAVGDIDNDGDPDLYVTQWGQNLLYENLADGTFRDISDRSGTADPRMSVSASFGDLDQDGDLDLYVVNYVALDPENPPNDGRPCSYEGLETACGPLGLTAQADRLYRNDGGRFTDFSKPSGILASEPQYGLGVAFGDYDEDGRTDIFVANDSGPNFLFHNLGGGRFEDNAWLAGVATEGEGRFQAGMGVDFGDADGDGRPDLFLTHFANDHNTLYLNRGDELFQDASYPSGLGGASRVPMAWGTRFYDFDNDGDQDLYVANGHIYPEVDEDGRESYRQADQLFLNDGRGRYKEASHLISRSRAKVSRGIAGGDLDSDGDVDLVVFEMGSTPSLLRNDVGREGSFLLFELRDQARTEGAGARLWVKAGGRIQRREATRGGSYASSSDPRTPFGLGTAVAAEKVEIRWPLGRRQILENLPANRRYVVYESRSPGPPKGR